MAIKLKATQTFEGIEGFVRRGQVFEVADQERVDKLVKELKFAEETDQDATISQEKKLEDYTVKELKVKAKDLNIDGYSDLLKEDLVKAIEAAAYTNGEQPKEQAGTNDDSAQLQDVVNFENEEENK